MKIEYDANGKRTIWVGDEDAAFALALARIVEAVEARPHPVPAADAAAEPPDSQPTRRSRKRRDAARE